MRGRPFGWFRLAWQKLLLAIAEVSASQSTLTTDSFAGASGTWTYTARDASGNLLSGVPVVFTVDAEALIDAAASTVTVSTGAIADDGVESCAVSHTILDTDADPVVGFAVAQTVLAVSGAGNTVTQPVAVSTIAGVVAGSFVSTTAATKTVSFTDASLAITQTQSVVVSGSSAWRANEPIGYTTQIDDPLDNRTSLTAWDTTYQATSDTRCVNITDATAPVSASGGIAAYFPIGFLDSDQPMALQEDFADAQAVYFAVAMRIPSPWDYHDSGFNKLGFIDSNANANVNITNEIVWSLRGTAEVGSRIEVHIQEPTLRLLTQNIAATDFTLDAWHKMEFQIIRSTGGLANGTVRWWQDGVLVGEYTDVELKASTDAVFKNFQFSPNWGGSSSDSKTSADYIQLDHIYVSTLAA